MPNKYLIFRNYNTGKKHYRSIIVNPSSPSHPRKIAKKKHRTATQANAYAERVEKRWAKLLETSK